MRQHYLFYILVIVLLQFCSFSDCKRREFGSWQCVSRSEKNPVYRVLRKNRYGKTQCATKIPNKCWFTKNLETCKQFKPKKDEVLTCGKKHKQLFGFTGYDRQQHWCNLKINPANPIKVGKPVKAVGKKPKVMVNPLVVGKKTSFNATKHEFPFMVRLDLVQIHYKEYDNGENSTSEERRTCGAFVIHKNWLQQG